MMVSHGHSHAYTYGVSFFYICLEQIYVEQREMIKHRAIAARGAKSDNFDEFLKALDIKNEKRKDVDHKSNLAMLNRSV